MPVCMYAGGDKEEDGRFKGWQEFAANQWAERSIFSVKQDVRLLNEAIVEQTFGKSLALARALPVEIVSVDSALVYRDMNIGTAKPSRDEQAACPHHLIDILSPEEAYSAARFCEDARRLMGEISARGRVPLLVGGTMLYYKALREGIMAYERRQRFRGPERFVALPTDAQALEDVVDDALAQHPDNGDVLAAVVLEASPKKLVVVRANGDKIEITGQGLKPVESGLAAKAPPQIKIVPGAIIRIIQTGTTWAATQLPEVEGAFVALDPNTGAIRALVGGFDFAKNKFNHVTQAWRQPGSAFKPFIYSAALEKGIVPSTIVNDAPLVYGAGVTGGQPWTPKNYDGRFEGPMTARVAMAKSRNIPAIRILEAATPAFTQQWITRFGFEASKHPAYLTMALGAGSVTPMQMAVGFATFANTGYRITPWLITKITDQRGVALAEYQPKPLAQQQRVIEPRNAFIMDSMLQTVTRSGTAARAQATLKRPDLYGKTGTTNDAMDAWFAGFQPNLVAVTWIGYDTPRNLGSRETGGGLSLPIWIQYMQYALKDEPVASYTVPPGVTNANGEWFYTENVESSVRGLGMSDVPLEGGEDAIPTPNAEERKNILDLFRNN